MLSPTISTNSNGKTSCAAARRSPRSYCGFAPVPVSPMTAKRTDFSARGATVSPAPTLAGAAAARCVAATVATAGSSPSGGVASDAPPSRIESGRIAAAAGLNRGDFAIAASARDRRHDAADDVDHDVGLHVAQDEMVVDDAVFELRGKLRQPVEQLRRERRQRQRSGIGLVDGELDVRRQLLDQRLAIRGRALLEVVTDFTLDDLPEVGAEDVAFARLRPQAADHLAERDLAAADLGRIAGFLEVRDLALGLVVDLEVVIDALPEGQHG